MVMTGAIVGDGYQRAVIADGNRYSPFTGGLRTAEISSHFSHSQFRKPAKLMGACIVAHYLP